MSLFQCVYEIKRNTLSYWIFLFPIRSWFMLILSCPLFGVYYYLCCTYSESLTRVFFCRFGIYTYHVSEYHLSITVNYIWSRTLNEWFNLEVSKLGTVKQSNNYHRFGGRTELGKHLSDVDWLNIAIQQAKVHRIGRTNSTEFQSSSKYNFHSTKMQR